MIFDQMCSTVILTMKGWVIVRFSWFLGKTIINHGVLFSVSAHPLAPHTTNALSTYLVQKYE